MITCFAVEESECVCITCIWSITCTSASALCSVVRMYVHSVSARSTDTITIWCHLFLIDNGGGSAHTEDFILLS